MIRTIEIRRWGRILYKKHSIGHLAGGIAEVFFGEPFPVGTYSVAISEKGGYRFRRYSGWLDVLKKDLSSLGDCWGYPICQDAFTQLFFNPDCRKTYSIKVAKIAH